MRDRRQSDLDYLIETAKLLSLSDEEFHPVPEGDAPVVLRSIREAFGSATPWWLEPERDLPCWGRRLPEDQSFRLITQIVPDPRESVWFLALHYGDRNLVFEGIPEAIERLLGECHLFEYAVASKKLDWMLGEEDHGVFVGLGLRVVERLKQLVDQQDVGGAAS